MVKPLLQDPRTNQILTASMSTVHAATNTQSVLDSVPKAGTDDLRKSRSILDNILLTTTGATSALEKVIPEVKRIGFMADSVRVPTSTVSLIILNMTFRSEVMEGKSTINAQVLNDIYRQTGEGPQRGLLEFAGSQNVSTDLIGNRSAVIIEGHDTHTRTGFIELDLATCDLPAELESAVSRMGGWTARVPVTHAKIFGWYDNEYGSYTNRLGDLTIHVHKALE